jgi:predicted phage terminase large subunit-like protein
MNDPIALHRFVDLALRQDLSVFIAKAFGTVSPGPEFAPNWHIEAIAWHLEECFRRNIKRLIITMPPRNLKSISASVAFPAWALGHDPSLRFTCVSYSSELSAKHSRDCRAVMESPWYRRAFPRTRINPRKSTEAEFETTAHGFRYATSVGGTLTGRGGNFILIDDPMKPNEAMSEARRAAVNEWYDQTLSSRLDNKKTDVIILIMQRLHVDDLVGHVLEQEDWVRLDLPAIAETPQEIPLSQSYVYRRPVGELLHAEREPRTVLDQLKINMGSAAFSAQYQQAPVPPEGNLIRWDWFPTYRERPRAGLRTKIVQSWDTASKTEEVHDYSVCTTWQVEGDVYYLIDLYRAKLEFPDLQREVVGRKNRFGAHSVVIEDKGSGSALIQALRREAKCHPLRYLPNDDKTMRVHGHTAIMEAGRILLPASAPWLDELRSELLAFPNGKHDDQVDSITQFLAWILRPRPRMAFGNA